ncbi:MAG: hypothetical protein NZ580_00995 [Bacteroidia bacterium]|nr:hypothetical protein [Bacteroidia bacterium]MDW8235537.1 hypothetical protein [Bacteroidia bacterium]
MQPIVAFPEKAQKELFQTLFQHTELLRDLTGHAPKAGSLEREPEHGLFICRYLSSDDQPIYLYLKTSSFGSPRTEYEQFSDQLSFLRRNPDALYYLVLLREAWFEWDDLYVKEELDPALRRIGYEEVLSAFQRVAPEQLPEEFQQEFIAYRRHIQREYESLHAPGSIIDQRLRYYVAFWHVREIILNRWREKPSYPLQLRIRTQPHVHSSHLEAYLLRQAPPYTLPIGNGEPLQLFWELERESLFLRLILPPMREKEARQLHTRLRKKITAQVNALFRLGRTRGTLKGIDLIHARQVNLLKIEIPALESLLHAYSLDKTMQHAEAVADELERAFRLLPELVRNP